MKATVKGQVFRLALALMTLAGSVLVIEAGHRLH
jgi:hypothetical protein